MTINNITENRDIVAKEKPFNLTTARFSFFHGPVTNKVPTKVMTISDAYSYILGVEAEERTKRLRAMTDAKERRAFKANNFDYVTFSGVFEYGSDDKIISHSGLICIDLDHVANISEARERLISFKFQNTETQLLFTSPSGDGLKWVVNIDLNQCDHRTWFKALCNYIRVNYNLEADDKCVNVSRACFLPHDINVYVNKVICPF